MSIIDNYRRIRDEIDAIALSCGRDPGDIRIIAVSKNFSAEIVQEAIDGGISLFGENRVQEAKGKIPMLRSDCVFHMVGHLQSNKARDAVRFFEMIHSIDTIGTAERLHEEAARAGKKQKILIQVNASGEESKSGIAPDAAMELVDGVTALGSLELHGLMTMAPFTDDDTVIRGCFGAARALLGRINEERDLHLRELSMGMSSDYRIAVEEGATMVRIGTALFGNR
ncbi:MAG: YggS family pyridoxal phosphate-dependent enzyme [Spirochaetes bacterium]|nr:YggS family pyridoxal phosphate-dependent enzyme [Spirochaetota bacterium]